MAVGAWQQHAPDGRRWRITEAGVVVEGDGVQRTPGDPVTVGRIWRRWEREIDRAAHRCCLPVELLIATVATESTSDLDPYQVRQEPGYVSDGETPHKVSIGLCHVMLGTAQRLLGTTTFTREYLMIPANALHLAALYIRDDAERTQLDPVLVAADYNAGGLYATDTNPWRLRSTGDHLDRYVRWLGDAIALGPVSRRDWEWFLAHHEAIT